MFRNRRVVQGYPKFRQRSTCPAWVLTVPPTENNGSLTWLMGSGGSVESAAPAPEVRVVLLGLQARIASVEIDGVVGEDRIAALKELLEEALKVGEKTWGFI